MDDDFRRQVERARRMTPSERVREGMQLFDRAVVLMTAGLRKQFPNATDEEIAEKRRERLAIIRRLDRPGA